MGTGPEEVINITVKPHFDTSDIIKLQGMAQSAAEYKGLSGKELYYKRQAGANSFIDEELLRRESIGRPNRPSQYVPSKMMPGMGYFHGKIQDPSEVINEALQNIESFKHPAKQRLLAGAAEQQAKNIRDEHIITEGVKARLKAFSAEQTGGDQKAARIIEYQKEQEAAQKKISNTIKSEGALRERIITQLEKKLKDLQEEAAQIYTNLKAEGGNAAEAEKEYADVTNRAKYIEDLINKHKSQRTLSESLETTMGGGGIGGIGGIASMIMGNPYIRTALAVAGAAYLVKKTAEPADEFIKGFGNIERSVGSDMRLFDKYLHGTNGLRDPERWARLTPQERQQSMGMFLSNFGALDSGGANTAIYGAEQYAILGRMRGFSQEQIMSLGGQQVRLRGPAFRAEGGDTGFYERSVKELNTYFYQILRHQVDSKESLQAIQSIQETLITKGLILDEKSLGDLSRILGGLNASMTPALQGMQGANLLQGLMSPGEGAFPFIVQTVQSMSKEERAEYLAGYGVKKEQIESTAGSDFAMSQFMRDNMTLEGARMVATRSSLKNLQSDPNFQAIIRKFFPGVSQLQTVLAQGEGGFGGILTPKNLPSTEFRDTTGRTTRVKEALTSSEEASKLATSLLAAVEAVDSFRGAVAGAGQTIKGFLAESGFNRTEKSDIIRKEAGEHLRQFGDRIRRRVRPGDSLSDPQSRRQDILGTESSIFSDNRAFAAAIEANEGKKLPNGWAVSAKGARGPRQIMPHVFEELKRRGEIPSYYNIDNPDHNRIASDVLLGQLGRHFGGDKAKQAAGYIAGQDDVDNAVRTRGGNWLSGMSEEVQSYVSKVLKAYETGSGGQNSGNSVGIVINLTVPQSDELADKLQAGLPEVVRNFTLAVMSRERQRQLLENENPFNMNGTPQN